MTIISREPDKRDPSEIRPDSLRQPAWHVIVLGTLTLSAYLLFWAYKTWKLLKNQAADEKRLAEHQALSIFKNVRPGLCTLCLVAPVAVRFIPFLAPLLKLLIGDAIFIYALATLFVGIAALNPNPRSFPKQHPLIACALLIVLEVIVAGLPALSEALSLPALLLSTLPAALVQHWLNAYLEGEEPHDLELRNAFTGVEMTAIVIGALFLGLIAAGSMMGIGNR